ncbi:MAG: 4-hydroxy-tetrahydrodipicolinate reductase [Ruminococcaceae bacterium]|nr:4-hydroxy-tetrahydrodipicolinate reductase [Oscillospiraceae bacterium]
MQKIRLIISGCNGRMGQAITRLCEQTSDIEIVAGLDVITEKRNGYPVFADPMECQIAADVLIDFSNATLLDQLLPYCLQRKLPAVICTTGHSPEQLNALESASKKLPLFRSGNMSLGINLITILLRKAAAVLGENFDVEIVEKHHHGKMDAPSGTAIMLADAVREGLSYEPEYVYERQSVRQPRGKQEIGISAVRGGTIVGEHEVLFCGQDEVITFKHTAYSREIFANGAITAARFLSKVNAPGLYDMNDALSDILA